MSPPPSYAMSSQRPFFGNFLAAFRAHSAMQKAAGTSTPSSAMSSAAAQQTSRTYTTTAASTANTTASTSQPSSNPRSTNKSAQPATAAAVVATAATAAGQFQSTRQHSTSPYSRSPASPASPGFMNRASNKRRGSDSSTEGFRDVVGEQKWYIGGRTAAGEERFYKLGVVKRVKSIDRLSLDRMSL